MSDGRYVLVRHQGLVWAVPDRSVAHIDREADGAVLHTAAGALRADTVLGLVGDLEVHPIGPLTARYVSPGPAGLAVHDGACVAVVDPESPPPALHTAVGAKGENESSGAGPEEVAHGSHT